MAEDEPRPGDFSARQGPGHTPGGLATSSRALEAASTRSSLARQTSLLDRRVVQDESRPPGQRAPRESSGPRAVTQFSLRHRAGERLVTTTALCGARREPPAPAAASDAPCASPSVHLSVLTENRRSHLPPPPGPILSPRGPGHSEHRAWPRGIGSSAPRWAWASDTGLTGAGPASTGRGPGRRAWPWPRSPATQAGVCHAFPGGSGQAVQVSVETKIPRLRSHLFMCESPL